MKHLDLGTERVHAESVEADNYCSIGQNDLPNSVAIQSEHNVSMSSSKSLRTPWITYARASVDSLFVNN